jgi:cytochrome c55X
MKRLAPLTLAVCVLAVLLGHSAGGVLPQLKAAGSLRVSADPQNFMPLRDNALAFPVGIGMRQAETALKEARDEILQRLSQRQVMTDIRARYGVLLLSPLAAASQPAGTVSNQLAQAETNVGEALYRRSCVECHGLNAKGSTLAKDLTSFKDTDEAFVKIVLNGRPGTAMAPFKGLLTEEDIRQIRVYIKGLP